MKDFEKLIKDIPEDLQREVILEMTKDQMKEQPEMIRYHMLNFVCQEILHDLPDMYEKAKKDFVEATGFTPDRMTVLDAVVALHVVSQSIALELIESITDPIESIGTIVALAADMKRAQLMVRPFTDKLKELRKR